MFHLNELLKVVCPSWSAAHGKVDLHAACAVVSVSFVILWSCIFLHYKGSVKEGKYIV